MGGMANPGEEQLALAIRWNASASFDQFVSGDNADAVAAVRQAATVPGPPVYLHGEPGTGRSHLLQAACGAASGAVAYVPLSARSRLAPDVLQGLEQLSLVALDDLDAVAGDRQWEEAVFHLFNRLGESGGRLLMAARSAPAHLGLSLPDLTSRLGWGLVYRLRPLDEEALLQALGARARSRGLVLPAETGRYLLRRFPRDSHSLFTLLDELDRAALAAQRRLTVPFVRELLTARRV